MSRLAARRRVSVAAPARLVAAVVAEPWLLRQCLDQVGLALDGPPGGQWLVGQRPRLSVRPFGPRLGLRVDRADERGLTVTGPGGLSFAAVVADASVEFRLRLPVPVGRRLDILLTALVDAVRERAQGLVGAPVVVGAAIGDGRGRVLAQQRDRPPADAGRWEFPGGRVEPGEDEPTALARECREELGVDIRVAERIGPDLILLNGWLLRIYAAGLTGDAQPRPQEREHRAVRWVGARQLAELDWLDADRVLLPVMRDRLDADSTGARG
jgi:8-oxo-dGTP pyrophosphatase MutT (NUDIX family)